MKVPNKIPEWLAELPKNALLSTQDLYQMFGYENKTRFINDKAGALSLPEPDYRGRLRTSTRFGICTLGTIRVRRWKAVTIRNFIRQYNRGEIT